MAARIAQDDREVLSQQETVVDEIQRRLAHQAQVLILVVIPLDDRQARIVGPCPIGGGPPESGTAARPTKAITLDSLDRMARMPTSSVQTAYLNRFSSTGSRIV